MKRDDFAVRVLMRLRALLRERLHDLVVKRYNASRAHNDVAVDRYECRAEEVERVINDLRWIARDERAVLKRRGRKS